MGQTLLKNIQKGVKSALVKQRIITHLIYAGSTTITDLSKSMGLSVPTVTKFVDEMCKEGYVNDCGKLETSGGSSSKFVWTECGFCLFYRGSNGGTVIKSGGDQL